MPPEIRNLSEDLLSDSWGIVKRNTFELRRRDGSWQAQVRETYDRGDGAGILLYDPGRGTVILTRQFRFPAFAHGEPGLLVEVPAGKLEGDDPATCARKEAEEEAGYRVADIEQVATCYASPGSVTEKLWLYIARYDPASRVSDGGGLHDEGEDIEVLELPFAEAFAMIASGGIADAKTIVLLQHLALSGRMTR